MRVQATGNYDRVLYSSNIGSDIARGSGEGDATARCDAYRMEGLTQYQDAWNVQKEMQLRRMRDADVADAALLVEHPAVYTLGRGSTEENLKFDPECPPGGCDIHRIERGGEVTFHGPGQLVLYPILNLNRHRRDLHWYMRQCEEVRHSLSGKQGMMMSVV